MVTIERFSNVTVNGNGLFDLSGADSVQQVVVTNATGGSFTLTVPGFGTTAAITVSTTTPTAATLQAALAAIPGIGAGNVIRVPLGVDLSTFTPEAGKVRARYAAEGHILLAHCGRLSAE